MAMIFDSLTMTQRWDCIKIMYLQAEDPWKPSSVYEGETKDFELMALKNEIWCRGGNEELRLIESAVEERLARD